MGLPAALAMYEHALRCWFPCGSRGWRVKLDLHVRYLLQFDILQYTLEVPKTYYTRERCFPSSMYPAGISTMLTLANTILHVSALRSLQLLAIA